VRQCSTPAILYRGKAPTRCFGMGSGGQMLTVFMYFVDFDSRVHFFPKLTVCLGVLSIPKHPRSLAPDGNISCRCICRRRSEFNYLSSVLGILLLSDQYTRVQNSAGIGPMPERVVLESRSNCRCRYEADSHDHLYSLVNRTASMTVARVHRYESERCYLSP
jgi:multisubunit Na+/H+ antiporter MnhG subunit